MNSMTPTGHVLEIQIDTAADHSAWRVYGHVDAVRVLLGSGQVDGGDADQARLAASQFCQGFDVDLRDVNARRAHTDLAQAELLAGASEVLRRAFGIG